MPVAHVDDDGSAGVTREALGLGALDGLHQLLLDDRLEARIDGGDEVVARLGRAIVDRARHAAGCVDLECRDGRGPPQDVVVLPLEARPTDGVGPAQPIDCCGVTLITEHLLRDRPEVAETPCVRSHRGTRLGAP